MAQQSFLEKIILFCLSILVAVSGIYSYKFMSILMPVLTLLVIWEEKGLRNIRLITPFLFLFLFLILGGVEILWAKQPIVAFKIWSKVFVTLIFSFFLLSALRRATPRTYWKGYILTRDASLILFGLILLQTILDEYHVGVFHSFKQAYMMKPSGSILGFGSFAGCALLWASGKKIMSCVACILVILLIFITQCSTAIYGFFLSGGVFFISYMFPFWSTRVAVIASYTFLLLAPFVLLLMAPFLSSSWVLQRASFAHRVMGWNFLTEKFFENPLLGWGMGATPYLPEKPELLEGFCNVIHPHKSSLQAYVELGLGGGILFALFFASLFWLVGRNLKDRLSIAVCNATISFAFIQAELTHSLWHNHWISWATCITGVLMVFLKIREGQLHAEGGHSKPPLILS